MAGVQNHAETPDTDKTPGGVTGKGFEPGNRANPGGRPKGMARRAREIVGADGDLLLQFWVTAMSGTLPRQVITTKPDGTVVTETVMESVSIADRLAASRLLAERGFGKPPAFAPIEDDDPLDLAERDQEQLAAQLVSSLDELAARRKRQAGPAKKTPARKAS